MKVIYVYDALCGWCFGFSPVMAQFNEEFGSEIEIQVISGGLRVGGGVGTINEVAPFIKTAYKTVESQTGVKFGERFVNGPLKSGSMKLNSLPPAIAMAIVRKKHPEKALSYSAVLHKMYYVDGVDPEDYSSYGKYAAPFGIEPDKFNIAMQDPENIRLAESDFRFAAEHQISGFPAVFVEKNGKLIPLAEGYINYNALKTRFLQIKQQ